MFEYINRVHVRRLHVHQTISRTFRLADDILADIRTFTASPEDMRAISPNPDLIAEINASSGVQYPVTIKGSYLIENPALCSSVPDLSVLIIVHTAPNHFEQRNAMRKTWANDTNYNSLGKVKTLFLFGTVHNQTVQIELEKEFKEHQDFLQGDFVDAYRNLTHKGVMGYRWVSERCRNAKYILKVDDDIVVDMYRLFTKVIPKYSNKTKQILCNHISPGTMRIIREKKSKWYVNEKHFKRQKFYPEYCSGFLVLFSNDVIPALFKATTVTPFFWVDDVYLYGLAPSHVPGIKYNGLEQKDHMLDGNKALKCYRNETMNNQHKCDYLVTGSRKMQVSVAIWSEMTKQYEKVSFCRSFTLVFSSSAIPKVTRKEPKIEEHERDVTDTGDKDLTIRLKQLTNKNNSDMKPSNSMKKKIINTATTKTSSDSKTERVVSLMHRLLDQKQKKKKRRQRHVISESESCTIEGKKKKKVEVEEVTVNAVTDNAMAIAGLSKMVEKLIDKFDRMSASNDSKQSS
ncbi:lactosylceramide 1,3-N-acetyl-beta-D-glucosaminyltransferase-like [Mya arenaria]|uniref:lactosylceramide 1,3-N-acetyl-beta-D-glucosaminyltransferase-like n=1 Tax=Mya arenaria TaxID=6604 RepID=UPI0022E140F0|nr:lactosylceramide 1,3-N-acetyl-beta-D-glucosaminyltransferase-like [Mya arenaria]